MRLKKKKGKGKEDPFAPNLNICLKCLDLCAQGMDKIICCVLGNNLLKSPHEIKIEVFWLLNKLVLLL